MTANCGCGCDLEGPFDERTVRGDLEAYRQHGTPTPTRRLVKLLRSGGIRGRTFLDIGGGVGAIHHDLLDAGAAAVTDVDGSATYLAAASAEARRRGHQGRIRYRHGDFVELSDDIEPSDVVTLVAVLCCYPRMEPLVRASAAHARRRYGLVYPRSAWWMRAAAAVYRALGRVGAGPGFVHAEEDVRRVIRDEGFDLRAEASTWYWRVELYERIASGRTRAAARGAGDVASHPNNGPRTPS